MISRYCDFQIHSSIICTINRLWWLSSCSSRAWTISSAMSYASLCHTSYMYVAPDVVLRHSMTDNYTIHSKRFTTSGTKGIRSSKLESNNSSTHPAVGTIGIMKCSMTTSSWIWPSTSSHSAGIVLPPGWWVPLWRVGISYSIPKPFSTFWNYCSNWFEFLSMFIYPLTCLKALICCSAVKHLLFCGITSDWL